MANGYVCYGIILFCLAGCGGPSMTRAEFDAADFGDKLYLSRAEKIVKNYFGNALKDPDSAHYKNLSVHKTYENINSQRVFGYVICVSINSRNSFGGYVGYQRYGLFTRDERLLDVQSDSKENRFRMSSLNHNCQE